MGDESIEVLPLGAGQDVGRSCVVVKIHNKRIMFDCGMHMGYNDSRRFPDFSFLLEDGVGGGGEPGGYVDYTGLLDAVVITHFHLDHCGGLVYFTEMCGYDGPIYMTTPTKAVAPILLEDYRKIMVERRNVSNFFTSEDIEACMAKVIPVSLHQTIDVDDELSLKAYYAGHVLGAAMFLASVGGSSVLYTGDYNMTPDRHLGAAWVDRCMPSVLITESTYATTIRDSKRAREGDFLNQVHQAVARGGKVLIPVFALGRAQELCILLDTYWDRMGLGSIPIYFSAGLTAKANLYYKLFIPWTNQKLKESFVKRNMFEFAHITEFDRAFADNPGPCVLFATPGMLHAGTSLSVFKKWAHSPKNLVILPGYCVKGTVGAKLLAGETDALEVDRNTIIDVKMQVSALSFSAHADAKGILQLIEACKPGAVVLVHGERKKMNYLKSKISSSFGIPSYNPPNGEALAVPVSPRIRVSLHPDLASTALAAKRKRIPVATPPHTVSTRAPKRSRGLSSSVAPPPIQGVLLPPPSSSSLSRIVPPPVALDELGIDYIPVQSRLTLPSHNYSLPQLLDFYASYYSLSSLLQLSVDGDRVTSATTSFSIQPSPTTPSSFVFSWDFADNDLALRAARLFHTAEPSAGPSSMEVSPTLH